MMTLRPYQQEAFSAVLQALRQERFVLLQAATGAGKTILFSALIRHCVERWGMRVGVIAHREVLVRQAYDKLLSVWPEGMLYTGLACRSAARKLDVESNVVIGSPQTLVKHAEYMPAPHLLIIDECHRLPPKNEKSQYRTLIKELEKRDPALHVLGVTATPFRLGHGFIYGEECRNNAANWWSRLHFQVTLSTLQKQGFLVPLRAKEAEDIANELADVKKDKGEFNTTDLTKLMEKAEHVGSAVKAYEKYGEERKHVVVFAVTISHAEKLAEAFRRGGYTAGCVHSQMQTEQRRAILKDFEEGRLQVVCNVGVLTEGWDCTAVDCMLMCRPTLSPALYVQMVGRGLRLHEGKKDCLILDLSGNCMRHGDPDEPVVIVQGTREEKKKKQESQRRRCPECRELLALTASVCPVCGYSFPLPPVEEIDAPVTMKEVRWESDIMEVEVMSCIPSVHQSRVGNTMLKLTLSCQHNACRIQVNYFMDLEGQGSRFGKFKARRLWKELSSGRTAPSTVQKALKRIDELTIPEKLRVRRKEGFFNVVGW